MQELFDVRFALRLWVRHPTLIAVASLSLGLGVGVTTTMYSVLSRVAHYDFGFADEDRLVVLWNTNTEGGAGQRPPTYDVCRRSFRVVDRSRRLACISRTAFRSRSPERVRPFASRNRRLT